MVVALDELIQSIELWLKLIKKEQSYVNPNLDPVLLVPGIGGSIMNAVNDEDGSEERVWVRILGADHEFRTKLWSRFDPSTGMKWVLSLGSSSPCFCVFYFEFEAWTIESKHCFNQ